MEKDNENEMGRLYDLALKELAKIPQNDSLRAFYRTQLIDKQEESEEYDLTRKKIDINNKRYNYTYNKQNAQLIINDKEVEPAGNLIDELQDFKSLLHFLKQVDKKFISKVLFYLDNYKRGRDYYDVQESLMTTIQSNNDTKSKKVLKLAIDDIFNYDFRKKSLSQLYIIFYNKLFAHISYYYDALLNTLAEYYIGNLCKGYSLADNTSVKEFINNKINQNDNISSFINIDQNLIFLSYAIKDRFFSFLLYIDAMSKNKILFVDWMFNLNRVGEIKLLKKNLGYFLRSADKLLFLQSFQSELFVSPNFGPKNKEHRKMIRQWCAWEIGVFHSNNRNFIEKNNNKDIMFKYSLNEHLTKRLNEKKRKKNFQINDFLGDLREFKSFTLL